MALLPGVTDTTNSPPANGAFQLHWLLVFAWILLAAAAFSAFFIWLNMRNAERDFLEDAAALHASLVEKTKLNKVILDGFVTHLSAAESMKAPGAYRFARNIVSRHPHVYMLEAAPRVMRSERSRFESQMEVSGHREFRIKTFGYETDRRWAVAPETPFFYPIVFMEPITPASKPVIGLDVYSVANFKDAIDRAFASNGGVASPPFDLAEGGRAYVLFRALNYGTEGALAGTPDAIAMLVVRAADLVEQSQLPQSGNVRLYHAAFDPQDSRGWVYRATQGGVDALASALLPKFSYSRPLGLPDQPFILKAEKQLTWSSLDIYLGAYLFLFSFTSFSALGFYSRARRRSERARRDAEQELRTSEERYRELIENTQEAILVIDTERRIVADCNRNAEKLIGLTRKELVGLPPAAFSPEIQPDRRFSSDKCSEMMGRALNGEAPVFEWTLQDAVGRSIPCEARLVRLAAGQGELIRASFTDLRERKQTEEALQSSEARNEAILHALPDLMFLQTRDGVYVDYHAANPADLLVPPAQFLGRRMSDVLPETLAQAFAVCFERAVATGETQVHEYPLPLEGRPRYFEARIVPCGKDRIMTIVRDISARKQAESDLRLAARALEGTAEGVAVADAGKTILTVNAAFSALTGYTCEEAVGQPLSVLESGRQGPDFYREMWQRAEREGNWQGETWDCKKNGEVYPTWRTLSVVRDDLGNAVNYVCIFNDITALKQSQHKAEYLATFDALTDLPNRNLFHDRIVHAIERSARQGNRLALMFIDLDNFKTVNDTLGHDVGDDLLKEAAQRLKASVRREDTVSRLGGDEFTVLIEGGNFAEIVKTAERIGEALSVPFFLANRDIQIGASIGISVYPEDGRDATALLKNADIAMYRAKEGGKNAYRFFSLLAENQADRPEASAEGRAYP